MKRIILGIIIGAVLFYLFVYYGGAEYLQLFGNKTAEVGMELKQYEKRLRDSTKRVREVAGEAGKRLKEHVP